MALQFLTDASSRVFAFERNQYRNSGTIALPVYWMPPSDDPVNPNGGQPPMPCRIVRLHGPIEVTTIVWQMVKEGQAPYVPNPYLFDKNLIFKRGRRTAAVPMPLPGYPGDTWSMSGEYEYHMSLPTDLNSNMPTGLTPWEQNITIDDAFIPGANFINALLEKLPATFTPAPSPYPIRKGIQPPPYAPANNNDIPPTPNPVPGVTPDYPPWSPRFKG